MATDFVAGLNGGVAGVLVGHPFDTVKIRLQTQDPLKPRYHGVFHCFSLIARQETPRGLYKGMGTPVVTIGCMAAVLFGSQAVCLRKLDQSKVSSHFLSGAFAGTVQSFLACPIELSKIKVQLQGIGQLKLSTARGPYAGSIDAFFKILRAEGVRGIYCGMGMTLMRDIPGFAVYFGTFEMMCRRFSQHSSDGEVGYLYLLLAGGIAGIANWGLVYPADVIKSRYQRLSIKERLECPSYLGLVKKSYLDDGIRSFSRGLSVALIRAFPTCAAIMSTVAISKRTLGKLKPLKSADISNSDD